MKEYQDSSANSQANQQALKQSREAEENELLISAEGSKL